MTVGLPLEGRSLASWWVEHHQARRSDDDGRDKDFHLRGGV